MGIFAILLFLGILYCVARILMNLTSGERSIDKVVPHFGILQLLIAVVSFVGGLIAAALGSIPFPWRRRHDDYTLAPTEDTGEGDGFDLLDRLSLEGDEDDDL